MSEKRATCVKCGAPIVPPSVGRPPLFCGPTCRAAAAYELRRIQRRLEGLEFEAARIRRDSASGDIRYFSGRLAAEELQFVLAEINAAEERLRLLLSQPRGKSTEHDRSID